MRESRERCRLRISEPLPLMRLGVGYRAPVTRIAIYSLGVMEAPILTSTLVDTGSEYSLILSQETTGKLQASDVSEATGSIFAGAEIPCLVIEVCIKIFGNWRFVKAMAPLEGGYEDIVGLPLLQKQNLCLRFPEATYHVANQPAE